MNTGTVKPALAGILLAVAAAMASPALAAPVSVNVSGAFTVATGTLSGFLGLGYTSGFTYDTDLSAALPGSVEFAAPASGGTGQELGAEFGGGSVTPFIPSLAEGYTSPSTITEMENDVTRTGPELLSLLPGGVYDFFNLNGWHPDSVFSGGSTINDVAAVEGVNVSLVFIGNMFSTPLTASSPMPGALDLNLVDYVVVIVEEFEGSEVVGMALQFGVIGAGGTFNNFTVVFESVVSEPAPFALLTLAVAVIGYRRHKAVRAA